MKTRNCYDLSKTGLEHWLGPVVLSGYHNALYDTRLASWACVETVAQAEKGNTRTECLWLNEAATANRQLRPL